MIAISKLYSSLTERIPKNLSVIDLIQADGWTLVESELGVGIAMSHRGGSTEPSGRDWIGSSLYDLAKQINSWNFVQSSLGLAAINAYWNTEPILQENFEIDSLEPPSDLLSILDREQIQGSKIGSVGHFPFLDKLSEQVMIFEMNPQNKNELPPSAAEYLLPQCKIVLLSASTLINKTFEPLTRLSYEAVIWLLGPSTTFTSQLSEYGINYLGGLLVKDKSQVKDVIRYGKSKELIKSSGVQKIQFKLRN